MAFDPDARRLIVAAERSLHVFTVETGLETHRVNVGDRAITGIHWAPSGDRIAITLEGGDVWVWNGQALVGLKHAARGQERSRSVPSERWSWEQRRGN